MKLGQKIFELRKKQGFSQESLAEKLHVSRQTISKWELGETSPDIKDAKEISKIFNISLDELLDNDITNILTQRISNTEKLAAMIIKIMKIAGVLLVLTALFLIYRGLSHTTYAWFIGGSEEIYCTAGDKVYNYRIELETVYPEKGKEKSYNSRISKIAYLEKIGGNDYLSNIIDIKDYEYDYELIDALYGYIDKVGGNCEK